MRKNHKTIHAALVLAGILLGGALFAGEEPGAHLRSPKDGESFLARAFADRPPLDASRVERKWLDLPYAVASPAEKLDIYLPNRGDGPFPVIVAIHGGSFNRGDKRDFQISPMLQAVDRGYAVVSINYRLTQEAVSPPRSRTSKRPCSGSAPMPGPTTWMRGGWPCGAILRAATSPPSPAPPTGGSAPSWIGTALSISRG